jgi:hypothetical protein
MEGQLPRRGLAALARGEGMTRIGKITIDRAAPQIAHLKLGDYYFGYVVEDGSATLGVWRLDTIWHKYGRFSESEVCLNRVS